MHSLASRLAKKIYANFGVHTPELNGSSMLWRITKDMGGTRKLVYLFILVTEELIWLLKLCCTC